MRDLTKPRSVPPSSSPPHTQTRISESCTGNPGSGIKSKSRVRRWPGPRQEEREGRREEEEERKIEKKREEGRKGETGRKGGVVPYLFTVERTGSFNCLFRLIDRLVDC